MNQDLTQIRERIKQNAAQASKNSKMVRAQSFSYKKPETKNYTSLFLGFCIILLSSATVWAMLRKNVERTSNLTESIVEKPSFAKPNTIASNDTQIEPIKPTPPASVNPINKTPSHQSKPLSPEANQKLEELAQKVEVWADRLWLLGVAHNENVNLTRRIHDSQNIGDPGYLVFDGEWRLNREPSTIQLTEEQRQKIVKGVR